MTTLKISDGKFGAMKELLQAMSVFADKSKSGYEQGQMSLKITSVTSEAQATDDLLAIQIMAGQKVRGALYGDSHLFSFKVKSGTDEFLVLIESSTLVSLVEDLHSAKQFSESPTEGKLMRLNSGEIYGFIPVWVVIDNAVTSIKIK